MRGEVALTLDGSTFLLRPSFAALVAAEAEIGSLFAVLERAGRGDLRLGDMGPLFWHCLAEAQDARGIFERRLVAAGPAALLPAFRALLGAVFGGS